MLEILIVISLCKNARENTLQRGGNGAIAVLYTILLWFGMEFYGAVVFGFIFGFLGLDGLWNVLLYLGALGCAGLGGYIAILISKVKPPIGLFANNQNSLDYDKNEQYT